jgi:hypothetical protein
LIRGRKIFDFSGGWWKNLWFFWGMVEGRGEKIGDFLEEGDGFAIWLRVEKSLIFPEGRGLRVVGRKTKL